MYGSGCTYMGLNVRVWEWMYMYGSGCKCMGLDVHVWD